MKISARNQLAGTVESVTTGAVNAEVVIKLNGGETITSIVTLGAVNELGLKPGAKAYAIIKASNVILAAD